MAGFFDFMEGALGVPQASSPEYAAKLALWKENESRKQKTLFDQMAEDRQEKRLRKAMGDLPKAGQYELPPDQAGPQIFPQEGTGIFTGMTPEQAGNLQAQALMGNINPRAFAPAFTDTMQIPQKRWDRQAQEAGANERKKMEIQAAYTRDMLPAIGTPIKVSGQDKSGKDVDYDQVVTGWKHDENGTPTDVILGPKLVSSKFSPNGGGGYGGGAHPYLARLANEKGVIFDKTSRKLGYLEEVVKGYADNHNGELPEADWVLNNIAGAKIKGDTAATAKVTGQKLNLEAAKHLVSRFEDAAKKLDLSNNSWLSWGQEKIKSVFHPQELTDLRALSVDLVQTLARAYAGKGATDKAIELEKWALSEHPSPLVAAAYAKSQLKSAQDRIGFMDGIYGVPKIVPALESSSGSNDHPADIKALLSKYGKR